MRNKHCFQTLFPASLEATIKPTFWCHLNKNANYTEYGLFCAKPNCFHYWTRSKQPLFSWESRIRLKINMRLLPKRVCTDELCDDIFFLWIVRNCGNAVRTAKWVMSRWCVALIHYSWDGWAECKWQWQTETLLLSVSTPRGVLDLISEGLRH